MTGPVIKNQRKTFPLSGFVGWEIKLFLAFCMMIFISTKFTVWFHSCQTATTTKLLPFLSLFKLCKKLFLTWREMGAGLLEGKVGRGKSGECLKCFFFYAKNFKICTSKKTVVILNTQALSDYTWEMSFSVW